MSRSKTCSDHLGNKYNSVKEMCRAYGINYNTFGARMRLGWDLKQALTADASAVKACSDHLGNKYNSINDMCKAYGINSQTLRERIKLGWTLEQALTSGTDVKNKCCSDHLGNEYKSIGSMCKVYGVSMSVFRYRIKSGWKMEDALTCKIVHKECSILGYSFKTTVDTCRYFECNKTTFDNRIRFGYDVEVCILTTGNRLTLEFIGLNNKAYYSLSWDPNLYTARQLIEKYRPDLLEAYDKSNPTGEYNPYRGDMEE